MVACSNKSGLTNRIQRCVWIQRCVLLLILPCSSELFYIESPWLIAANNLKDPLQLGHGQLHYSLASYAQDAHRYISPWIAKCPESSPRPQCSHQQSAWYTINDDAMAQWWEISQWPDLLFTDIAVVWSISTTNVQHGTIDDPHLWVWRINKPYVGIASSIEMSRFEELFMNGTIIGIRGMYLTYVLGYWRV